MPSHQSKRQLTVIGPTSTTPVCTSLLCWKGSRFCNSLDWRRLLCCQQTCIKHIAPADQADSICLCHELYIHAPKHNPQYGVLQLKFPTTDSIAPVQPLKIASSRDECWLLQEQGMLVQAVKGSVVYLEEALAGLSERLEAGHQHSLKRSQAVADLSQRQWDDCRYIPLSY